MSESNNANVNQFGYEQELKRTLGVKELVVFGVTFMAPVSSMQMFGFMSMVSAGHAVLCYLAAFIAIIFTVMSYHQMIQEFPIAGSVYVFTQRGIHPTLGFLAGWMMIWDYFLLPMVICLTACLFANALIPVIPVWLWTLILIVPALILNIRGVEFAAKTNIIITALMIIAILAFVIAAIRYAALGIDGAVFFNPTYIFNPATFNFQSIMAGSIMAVMSYLGFDSICTLAEEAIVPPKKIGHALIIAVLIETILYLLVAYFGTVVAPDITVFQAPESAFFDIAMKVGGMALQIFISLVIICSGFAAVLACQAATSRVFFGMGRDNLIPKKFFGYINPKTQVPTYSLILTAIIILAGSILIPISIITNIVAFGSLWGFTFVNLSVIVYFFCRKRSGRVFQHLILPIIGMIVCLTIIFTGMAPLAKILGFSWMGIGVIYLLVRSTKPEFRELLKKVSIG